MIRFEGFLPNSFGEFLHDRTRSRFSSQSKRAGVTLVEMMVVVAIVVLMMAVLAEIFSLASGVVTAQRTLGELDQRMRQAVQLIRSDLSNKTVPLLSTQPIASGNQLGYFEFAESSPADPQGEDTDDVLA